MRSWNGKVMVDMREFYVKDGKSLPTRKGILAFLSCSVVYVRNLNVCLCACVLYYYPTIIHVDLKYVII